jgi:hypothetical protein
VQWPSSFYAHRRGEGCPTCAEGRQHELSWGIRFYAGETCDADLQKAAVRRGYAYALRTDVVALRALVAPVE